MNNSTVHPKKRWFWFPRVTVQVLYIEIEQQNNGTKSWCWCRKWVAVVFSRKVSGWQQYLRQKNSQEGKRAALHITKTINEKRV